MQPAIDLAAVLVRLLQAMLPHGGLKPAREVQLAQNVFDVNLHRGIADPEFARDGLVVQPFRETFENLALARRQEFLPGASGTDRREQRAFQNLRQRVLQNRRPGRGLELVRAQIFRLHILEQIAVGACAKRLDQIVF